MTKDYTISAKPETLQRLDDIGKRLMRDGSFDPAKLEGVRTTRRKGKRIVPRGAIVEMLCRDILEAP
jgi:hypothetical protein